MEIKDLTKEVQECVKTKAEICEKSVEDYLNDTNFNYCIVESNQNLLSWTDGNDLNYIVYGGIDEAREDLCDGDVIITEAQALEYLNEKYKNGEKLCCSRLKSGTVFDNN